MHKNQAVPIVVPIPILKPDATKRRRSSIRRSDKSQLTYSRALVDAARLCEQEGSSYAVLVCRFKTDAGKDAEASRKERYLVIDQLRRADRIAGEDSDDLVVVAANLVDEQDAAGVAYRLLATKVDPLADRSSVMEMCIGIAVADQNTPLDQPLLAANAAAGAAAASAWGEFRITDLRK